MGVYSKTLAESACCGSESRMKNLLMLWYAENHGLQRYNGVIVYGISQNKHGYRQRHPIQHCRYCLSQWSVVRSQPTLPYIQFYWYRYSNRSLSSSESIILMYISIFCHLSYSSAVGTIISSDKLKMEERTLRELCAPCCFKNGVFVRRLEDARDICIRSTIHSLSNVLAKHK